MNIDEEYLQYARRFYSKEWITSSFEYEKKGAQKKIYGG